ncbi:MAG TPA: asparagine--tRNA ligase [Myxococcota bacterium]|jgi:asparaginyl-tRNA synthetase|nr:asparagine--tRNA ligase [Myxococcota bacterium]
MKLADRVWIEDIARHEGAEVELRGWLYNRRSSGKLHFLQVRDGTGIIQCVVFKGDVTPELFQRCDHLPQETSLIVRGGVRKDPRSPIGYEVQVKDVTVVAEPTGEYPIGPKEHGVAFLMDQRHLWLRSRKQAATMRVRAAIVAAVREYFDSNGFVLLDAPIFTPAACEGTTTLFHVDYHGTDAYLTQSGQLYMEAGCAALGKVYCFGPTFRAEKSKTRRHLSEFWMVEPEVAYLDLDGDMDLAEDFLSHVVRRVLERRRPELEALERDLGKLEAAAQTPYPRVTYDEAVEVIRKRKPDFPPGEDFGAEEETIVGEGYDRPVIIHRYPHAIKAFYMKRDPARPDRALNMDVIAPEGFGEIIGGGQREDDLATLEAALEKHELPKASFEWYLDLRRYGTVPHAGFGLGIERTVAWITGTHHVRECIPFPRMLERLTP